MIESLRLAYIHTWVMNFGTVQCLSSVLVIQGVQFIFFIFSTFTEIKVHRFSFITFTCTQVQEQTFKYQKKFFFKIKTYIVIY